jgi:hypothetical protein
MPEPKPSREYPCPECGGDATRTRDRFPFTTHGSRAYLWILFGVLAGGYITTILLVSNFSGYTTPQSAIVNTGGQKLVYTPAVDADSMHLRELERAVAGDDELLERIRTQLRSALAGENEFGADQSTRRIRLETHRTQVLMNQMWGYSVFGRHVSRSHAREVFDPRTLEPVPRFTEGRRRVTNVRLWPVAYVQWVDAAGNERTIALAYLGLLGYLTMLVPVSWLIARCAPERLNRAVVLWMTMAVLILASAVIAVATQDTRFYNTNTHPLALSTTAWIDADRVRDAIQDDGSLRELLGSSVFALRSPDSSPVAVLVVREYQTPVPDPALPGVLESSWQGWWLLGRGSAGLYSIGTTTYEGDRTPEQIEAAPRTAFWSHLYEWGRIRFEVHRPRTSRSIDLDVLNGALVFGIVWWIWVLVSRIHRFRTWRVQRKRVNRGQCIYCGYRASDEALAARWEESPSTP